MIPVPIRRFPSLVGALARYVACHLPLVYRMLRSRYADRAVTGSSSGERGEVCITFTTTPSRIGSLRPFLCGLYSQDFKVRRIVVNIPAQSRREGRAYVVPRYLQEDPNVEIHRVEEDWGPATKLLPTLAREDAETLVISVDDDNVYAGNHIGNLVDHAHRHPDDAVGHYGYRVSDFLRSPKRPLRGTAVREPEGVDVLAGCGSLAVRPRFFDEAVTDYGGAPDEAFYVDDVWFSGHLALRGVDRLVVPLDAPAVYLSALNTFRTPRLDRSENRDDANNWAAIEHFGSVLDRTG